jgi:hypothetical protein
MSQYDLILLACAGCVSLAVCAVIWALAQTRRLRGQISSLSDRLADTEERAEAAQASAEAFDSALLAVEDGRAVLVSGADSFAACVAVLGLAKPDAQALVSALMRADPDHARRLRGLFERGEPCAFETRGASGAVSV